MPEDGIIVEVESQIEGFEHLRQTVEDHDGPTLVTVDEIDSAIAYATRMLELFKEQHAPGTSQN
jgi:hypothetical protein